MKAPFAESVLQTLLDERVLDRGDALLAVCAEESDRDLLVSMGFTNVTLSNLDVRWHESAAPFRWSRQDAQHLTFGDREFDFGFVSAGVHHCSAPHAALVELYRVSRKGIVILEARDSWLMRAAQRLGLASEFEINPRLAANFEKYGVDNTDIPNHCYRWTERELTKTLRSYDPTGKHLFRFFYGLTFPRRSAAQRVVAKLLAPARWAMERAFKKQCNDFAMAALRPVAPGDLWPWLKMVGDRIELDREYVTTLRASGRLPPE